MHMQLAASLTHLRSHSSASSQAAQLQSDKRCCAALSSAPPHPPSLCAAEPQPQPQPPPAMQPSAGVKRSRSQDEQKEGDTNMSFNAAPGSGARETQRPRREQLSDHDAQLQPQDHSASPPVVVAATAWSNTAAHSLPASQGVAQADRNREAVGAAASAAVGQPAAQHLSSIQLPSAAAQQSVTASPRLQLLRLSPGQCCDQDSLSLVFSLLGTADFLAAIRACRQWNSARMKHSAWPQLHLPSFIQSLRDDGYDGPDRRRLVVTLVRGGDQLQRLSTLLGSSTLSAAATGGSAASRASSAAAHAGSVWRNVTEVKLRAPLSRSLGTAPRVQACERALQEVAQLPYLSVLNLHNWMAGDAAMAAVYSAVSSRLQALLLSDCSYALLLHLPLLSNLRVLVLDMTPAAIVIAPLHRLEYLRFHASYLGMPISAHLEIALRDLSSSHSLRSLSIETSLSCYRHDWKLLFRPVQTVEEAAQLAQADAAQTPVASVAVDWTKPCALTDVSLMGAQSTTLVAAVCTLPQLTRLQCESHVVRPNKLLPIDTLAQLRQLRLKWRGNPGGDDRTVMQLDWSHLQPCSQLRVLELSCASAHGGGPLRVPAVELQSVLAACTATLEELRLGSFLRIDYGEVKPVATHTSSSSSSAAAAGWTRVKGGWSVLARCTQLRVLKIALQPDTESSAMLAALALLPNFQSLELDLAGSVHNGWTARSFELPSDLLLCFRHSSSWCSLHIRWPCNYIYGDLLQGTCGLPLQLPPEMASDAVAKCLRVHVHMPESAVVRSYAIRADEHGVKRWRQV